MIYFTLQERYFRDELLLQTADANFTSGTVVDRYSVSDYQQLCNSDMLDDM